jgi:hypothetical protein
VQKLAAIHRPGLPFLIQANPTFFDWNCKTARNAGSIKAQALPAALPR